MANDLNSVALVGRLTKDCEVRSFDNGGSIINMSIAVNHSKKQQDGSYKDEASFIDVHYSTKSTKIAEYLKKGAQISIDGSLKQERWQNKEGQTNSKIVVYASNIQLLGGKPSGNGVPKEAQGIANAFGGEAFPEDNFPLY